MSKDGSVVKSVEFLEKCQASMLGLEQHTWEEGLRFTYAALFLTGVNPLQATVEDWVNIVYPVAIRLAREMGQ